MILVSESDKQNNKKPTNVNLNYINYSDNEIVNGFINSELEKNNV